MLCYVVLCYVNFSRHFRIVSFVLETWVIIKRKYTKITAPKTLKTKKSAERHMNAAESMSRLLFQLQVKVCFSIYCMLILYSRIWSDDSSMRSSLAPRAAGSWSGKRLRPRAVQSLSGSLAEEEKDVSSLASGKRDGG